MDLIRTALNVYHPKLGIKVPFVRHPSNLIDAAQSKALELPEGMDLLFPHGRPEEIDYREIDRVGRALLREINLRPWLSTVEYCSGHPMDRPRNEHTEIGPNYYMPGLIPPIEERWDVDAKVRWLESKIYSGALTTEQYRVCYDDIMKKSLTQFYLSLHVFNNDLFITWMRSMYYSLLNHFGEGALAKYEFNVSIGLQYPIQNSIIKWSYYTCEQRKAFHTLMLRTLGFTPV